MAVRASNERIEMPYVLRPARRTSSGSSPLSSPTAPHSSRVSSVALIASVMPAWSFWSRRHTASVIAAIVPLISSSSGWKASAPPWSVAGPSPGRDCPERDGSAMFDAACASTSISRASVVVTKLTVYSGTALSLSMRRCQTQLPPPPGRGIGSTFRKTFESSAAVMWAPHLASERLESCSATSSACLSTCAHSVGVKSFLTS